LSETQSADAMLRARARLVVPGGMWGHLNAARLPDGYPQFFASAEGCRVRDVDGREYIDFMCSWGPILLGHRHPKIQAAAEAQLCAGCRYRQRSLSRSRHQGLRHRVVLVRHGGDGGGTGDAKDRVRG
jgi:glutamate-1-semialdehyde aminotransferase